MRQLRQLVLECLYESETSSHPPDDVLERRLGAGAVDVDDTDLNRKDARKAAMEMLHGALESMDDSDALIARAAARYPLENMAVIDRNILRLAIWELLTDDTAPVAAVINEAVELAHRYGGESSPSFVNGVLRTVSQEISGRGPAIAQTPASPDSIDIDQEN
jgi:N utilization substance protein B